MICWTYFYRPKFAETPFILQTTPFLIYLTKTAGVKENDEHFEMYLDGMKYSTIMSEIRVLSTSNSGKCMPHQQF